MLHEGRAEFQTLSCPSGACGAAPGTGRGRGGKACRITIQHGEWERHDEALVTGQALAEPVQPILRRGRYQQYGAHCTDREAEAQRSRGFGGSTARAWTLVPVTGLCRSAAARL